MRPSGDDETSRWFTQLYHETARDILAYLLRRCVTAEDAADGLAETYTIAWAKRNHIPHGTQARPWLFGVARNVMHRKPRPRRARQHHHPAARRDAHSCRPANETGSETNAPVHEALTRLSPIDRGILTLVAWDGLTPADVAEIVQMSPNLVRVRLHRARAKLRRILSSAALTGAPTGQETADTSPSTTQRALRQGAR